MRRAAVIEEAQEVQTAVKARDPEAWPRAGPRLRVPGRAGPASQPPPTVLYISCIYFVYILVYFVYKL